MAAVVSVLTIAAQEERTAENRTHGCFHALNRSSSLKSGNRIDFTKPAGETIMPTKRTVTISTTPGIRIFQGTVWILFSAAFIVTFASHLADSQGHGPPFLFTILFFLVSAVIFIGGIASIIAGCLGTSSVFDEKYTITTARDGEDGEALTEEEKQAEEAEIAAAIAEVRARRRRGHGGHYNI